MCEERLLERERERERRFVASLLRLCRKKNDWEGSTNSLLFFFLFFFFFFFLQRYLIADTTERCTLFLSVFVSLLCRWCILLGRLVHFFFLPSDIPYGLAHFPLSTMQLQLAI